MKMSTTMPDFCISKSARAPAGMRCYIKNKWHLVTHRGLFHNGEAFVIFRLPRNQFSIAYGNIASIIKTEKPSNLDPVFIYEHLIRWRKAAQGMGINTSHEQYLKETGYCSDDLQKCLYLLDRAENFIKELKRRNSANRSPSMTNVDSI